MTRGISAVYERNHAADPAASGAGKCGALLATVLWALPNLYLPLTGWQASYPPAIFHFLTGV